MEPLCQCPFQSRSFPLPLVQDRHCHCHCHCHHDGPLADRGSAPSRVTRGASSLPFMRLCLVLALSMLSGCLAQKDPVNNFCRRFGHQTAVIDQRLYIDGGLINWNPISTYNDNYTNTWLLYQDLNLNSSTGMPQLYANLTKNDTIPNVNGGYLWADDVNKMFYLFGGEYNNETPPDSFTLYGYDVLNDNWVSRGAPDVSINPVSYGAGVSVSERGEGYYFGGWLSNNSVSDWSGPPLATTGLIKYDLVSNTWTNNTGPDGIRRAEGAMVYMPAGDGGMLLYLGGIIDLYGNGSVAAQPMETVFLYDVLSSKWYAQNTTGDVPGDRRRFCAGVTWVPDRSSYNVYVYGGASFPPRTAGYDDVFVLSIPSFTWTRLYPNDNSTGQYPHHSLTCNVISGAQMLIIGGSFPLTQDCDVAAQWGTHNIDLTESRPPNRALWQLFDPTQVGYTVPDPVIDTIGGNATGGATVTVPPNGWDSPDLSVLMTRTATIAARTPTRNVDSATSGSSSDSDSDDSDSSGHLSKGGVAGVAVGAAVGGAALLASCLWMLQRRYWKRNAAASTAAVAASAAGGGHPGVSYAYTGINPGSPGELLPASMQMMQTYGAADVPGGVSPGNAAAWPSQHVAGYGAPSSPYSLVGSMGRPLTGTSMSDGGATPMQPMQPVELDGSGLGSFSSGSPVVTHGDATLGSIQNSSVGPATVSGADTGASTSPGAGSGAGLVSVPSTVPGSVPGSIIGSNNGNGLGTSHREAFNLARDGAALVRDEQGHIWVPTESEIQLPPGRSPVLDQNKTIRTVDEKRSLALPVAPEPAELPHSLPLSPQELSSERDQDVLYPGNREDRKHETFYHP